MCFSNLTNQQLFCYLDFKENTLNSTRCKFETLFQSKKLTKLFIKTEQYTTKDIINMTEALNMPITETCISI